MNIPSATPPVAGSAANATATVAAKPADSGGIADLFSALLASLTGASVVPPSPAGDGAESDAHSACIACAEASADDPAADATSVDDTEGPESGKAPVDPAQAAQANLAALLATLDAGVDQPAPVNGETAPVVESAPKAAAPVSASNGAALAVLAAQTDAGEVAVTDDAAESVPAQNAASENAEASEAALQTIRDRAAQSPVARGFGRVAVEVARQGQSEAMQAAAPGRTIGQLVRDAISTARDQAASSDVAEATTTDAPDAPLVARRPADALPELRPAPSASVASAKTAEPGLGVVVPASGNGAPAPDAVAAHSRETARAQLPQSVDVRDVGDYTIRSVRYLGGRTDEIVTVRLVPRSLGELQVAVRAAADGLEVVLTAANHVTRERLEGQLIGLRELFAREGIDVRGVSVQAPPTFDLSGQMPSQHQHHQHNTGHAARFQSPAYREQEQNPPEQQQARSGRPNHDGGLNMLA